MMHGRRYGDRESHPIPVWNGLLEEKHRKRIGPAIWLYLRLLDAVTVERDGIGLVYGGAPVKAMRLGRDLGFSERTIRADLKVLVAGGYLRLRRTPYGFSIEVLNSAKFGIWSRRDRAEQSIQSQAADRNEFSDPERKTTAGESGRGLPTRAEGSFRYKEDATTDSTNDTAKEKREAKTARLLPDWLPLELWNDYLEMRKRIRRPVATERAVKLLTDRLEAIRVKHGDAGVRRAIEQSIMNSWQGIFEPRDGGGNGVAVRNRQTNRVVAEPGKYDKLRKIRIEV